MPINLDKLNAAGAKITAKLDRIRESVDAPLGDYETKNAPIEITGEKLHELAAANPGKPIIIGVKLHLAYIKDHTNPYYHGKEERAANTAENGCYYGGNRIHFYYCQHLQRIAFQGRQHRYRQTPAIESTQTVDFPEAKDARIHLAWCQFCIREFQKIGRRVPDTVKDQEWLYDEPAQVAKYGGAKTLKEFHHRGNPLWDDFIKGLKTPAAPSGYPSNWNSISAAFRRAKNYTCEICGVDCRTHTGLTDAHHINGEKSDCRYKNLQCLCIYHHSQRPKHEHYKPTESEMQILRQLWEEQNIPAHLPG